MKIQGRAHRSQAGNRKLIGVVAPSSVLSQVELELALAEIRGTGFDVQVHPQCFKKHFAFAGTHEQRAKAFWQYACDPSLPIIWAARGGYGANHLLPYLEKYLVSAKKKGPVPPRGKIYLGCSDSVALLNFLHHRLGWKTVHAVMPGLRSFLKMTAEDRKSLFSYLMGREAEFPWDGKKLKFLGVKPKRSIQGTLVGGNMAVLGAVAGTRFWKNVKGPAILFLEDIDESVSRIDRMLEQLEQLGILENVQAIILGDFLRCEDTSPTGLMNKVSAEVLKQVLENPAGSKAFLKPLRKKFSQKEAFQEIFGGFSKRTGIPVAYGLPVGHGPGYSPLPLYVDYTLRKDGVFEIKL